eukprot:CAMPEP_0195521450 /NCGR_PEP_ID=MMETSP0794_2-20130614/18707_1 /TAXON_ID=515487 /ORGANISM="Stephanopyxis turris, Strain CCMP 815" /LENGTH=276 /DNA_ID=CAMNT_0040651013 /DNA_START=156 /DNA_END=982 /DNA_ORIENTATION=+
MGTLGGQSEILETIDPSPLDESSNVLQGWSKRWKNDMLGWHLSDVHPVLRKYLATVQSSLQQQQQQQCKDDNLTSSPGLRVLVPLCGKSVDVAYLADLDTVTEVVGVEGIQKAIHEFSVEHPNLKMNVPPNGGGESCGHDNQLRRFRGRNTSMIKGDFFCLDDRASDGLFDVVWDRASIVAIAPDRRKEYVSLLSKLMNPGGVILLVTIDKRDGTTEARRAGPPYSLDEGEVRRLFRDKSWVESVTKLEEYDEMVTDIESKKRWEKKGLKTMFEVV